MKVITIHHIDRGAGCTMPIDQVKHFEHDLTEELNEIGSEEAGYTKEEIKPFQETLKDLNVGDEVNFGDVWSFKCSEMTEEEYNSMPEWSGW